MSHNATKKLTTDELIAAMGRINDANPNLAAEMLHILCGPEESDPTGAVDLIDGLLRRQSSEATKGQPQPPSKG